MSEQVKSTVLRFANFRSPALINETVKKEFFIQHFDGKTGFFFDLVGSIPNDSTPIAHMKSKAGGMDPIFKSQDEIKSVSSKLFNFGKWLKENMGALTISNVSTYISTNSPEGMDSDQLIVIWDNLFYQSLVFESGYLREDLMVMLVADHFVRFVSSINQTADDYTKLAKAEIVFPKEIFSRASELPTETDWDNAHTVFSNKKIFAEHMSAFQSNVKSKRLEKAKAEVVELEKRYFKTEEASLRNIDKEFESTLRGNITSAEPATYTDPNTQKVVDGLSKIDRPAFDYTPAEQITSSGLKDNLTTDAYNLLTDNKLTDEDSYQKVLKSIDNLKSEETSNAFDKSNLVNTFTEHDGVLINDELLRYRNGNMEQSYSVEIKKRHTTVYDLYMILFPGEHGFDIDAISYTLGVPVDKTFTEFEYDVLRKALHIHLTPNAGITIEAGASSIEFSGSIDFDSGAVFSWNTNVEIEKSFQGRVAVKSRNLSREDYVPNGFGITRLGYTEYKKVEQSLCCYVPGEVSHIENVLAREYKERSTRRLRTVDETTSTTRESEKESVSDTVSTSRFDMQQAVSDVISQSTSLGTHKGFSAGLSAGYGPVSIQAGVDMSSDYAQNSSKETAKSQSLNFAQDITNRALETIVSKVKEERVKRIVEEFEEQNKHGVDNRQGSEHISGVYRWVDLIYKNQIKNYGMRLSYEFMIPDPSFLHYKALSQKVESGGGVSVTKPLNPATDSFGGLGNLKSAKDLTEANYSKWAALYGAEVTTPPPAIKMVGKSYSKSEMPDGVDYSKNKAVTDNIILPEGYGLDKAYITSQSDQKFTWSHLVVSIASTTKWWWGWSLPTQNLLFLQDDQTLNLDKYSESVPISVYFSNVVGGVVVINLQCTRKLETFETWQLETYNAIMSAYDERLTDYKNAVAEVEVRNGQLMSTNPAHYREIEFNVLKKNCIAYLIGNENMGKSFVSGNNLTDAKVRTTQAMDQYTAKVKFFEQAFEWDIMSYNLYPYYWAGKNRWEDLYAYEGGDAQFRAFMRSGMGRVAVTIRPGFEAAVLYYMETGQIWNGGSVPVIGNDLYLSIVDEMKEPEYDIEETWTTRVPSSLTLLQSDTIALNASGLPCWCDTGNPPSEDIKASTALDGLSVHIDGQA